MADPSDAVVTSDAVGPGMVLVRPAAEHLASFLAALRSGFSPDTRRVGVDEELIARVEADPQGYLRLCEDREGVGDPITLPDGSQVPRLPGIVRWMWDGGFAGSIGLRWQPGTTDLPPTCLGHIGYAVVPWRRRRGYATAALRQMLEEARAVGLPFVQVDTQLENIASQRVILACGAGQPEVYQVPEACGGGSGLRYRIPL